MELKDKVVLVTGGAGYIGGAIVDRFAEGGAKLAVFDIDRARCEEKVAALRSRGCDCEYFLADLCDYDAVKTQVQAAVAKFGRLDVLVCCAGVSARRRSKPFVQQDISVLHEIIDMNLYGTLHTLHAAIPYMVEAKQGKIINIGSLVGMMCVQKCLDYGAAKAGIISMTRTLALELGPSNINVNCVSPGKIPRPDENHNTAMIAYRHQVIRRALLGKDIAELVYFLATPAADAITGQNYPVCGGRSIGLRGDSCNNCWRDLPEDFGK